MPNGCLAMPPPKVQGHCAKVAACCQGVFGWKFLRETQGNTGSAASARMRATCSTLMCLIRAGRCSEMFRTRSCSYYVLLVLSSTVGLRWIENAASRRTRKTKTKGQHEKKREREGASARWKKLSLKKKKSLHPNAALHSWQSTSECCKPRWDALHPVRRVDALHAATAATCRPKPWYAAWLRKRANCATVPSLSRGKPKVFLQSYIIAPAYASFHHATCLFFVVLIASK